MVSTTSSSVTGDPIIKVEEAKFDVKAAQSAPLTGRQLIKRYLSNEVSATLSYKKVCNALEIFDRLEEQGRIQFIEQLVDTSDLLDTRCGSLVSNLTHISWYSVPVIILEKFQKMLGEIAVRHVCHTETVYQTAVVHLLPKYNEDQNMKPNDEEGTKIFTIAHQLIAHVLKCFPMSSKSLMSTLRRHFPHVSRPSYVYNGYIRNLIQVGEYAPFLFTEIWDVIIDNSVVVDSFIATKEGNANGDLMFRMEIKDEDPAKNDSESYNKLDVLNSDIFAYLAMKHNVTPHSAFYSIQLGENVISEDIFNCFLSILESRLLMSSSVRYTSFIWLYLCSLDESYPIKLLDFLWSVIIRPQRTQSDTKKSHGAANYLAAFVARAKCIRRRDALNWMKQIVDWSINYLNNISNLQTYAGGARHGLFYALCQAFFIILCFRYKEFVKSGDMPDISRWSIGRIVHCSLEPLKYVSRPVAHCFGAISRSLQLVYVNHILYDDETLSRPFELSFPLDCYGLATTEDLISPLMRRFSPMAEDVHSVTAALEVKKEEDNDSGMDFLEEDDFMAESTGSRPVQINQQGSLFTVYSTSPGLCHFDSTPR